MPSISYETLAQAIDAGQISNYIGKTLQIRGHVRGYGIHGEEPFLIIGERLPEKRFPTMFCMLSPSESKDAAQFQGKAMGGGLYHSAQPDRTVTVEAKFTGTISEGERLGLTVYDTENCKLVE